MYGAENRGFAAVSIHPDNESERKRRESLSLAFRLTLSPRDAERMWKSALFAKGERFLLPETSSF
jgi:hypothetical protein